MFQRTNGASRFPDNENANVIGRKILFSDISDVRCAPNISRAIKAHSELGTLHCIKLKRKVREIQVLEARAASCNILNNETNGQKNRFTVM